MYKRLQVQICIQIFLNICIKHRNYIYRNYKSCMSINTLSVFQFYRHSCTTKNYITMVTIQNRKMSSYQFTRCIKVILFGSFIRSFVWTQVMAQCYIVHRTTIQFCCLHYATLHYTTQQRLSICFYKHTVQ